MVSSVLILLSRDKNCTYIKSGQFSIKTSIKFLIGLKTSHGNKTEKQRTSNIDKNGGSVFVK